jgi:hypothetical protein
MASKTTTIRALSDGVAGVQPQPELNMDSSADGKPCKGAASPDPTGQAKAADSQDFPYFAFYPYGYLY